MNYFTSSKINDHIYQIKDPMGVLTTLVIGKEKALLIDTAYGIGDLKTYISNFTNLPLIVVNSHGHMDHSCGNYQFDNIYISPKDFDLCKLHNSRSWRNNNIDAARKNNLIDSAFDIENYLSKGTGKLVPLNENDVFDLGELTIQVINLEGHTMGSLGFLIKEDKLLVTSDAICPFVWLFLPESSPLSTYKKMLDRVVKMDFDGFLVGHGPGVILEKERMLEFLKVANELTIEKSIKVNFNNFDGLNSYCYTPYKLYDQKGAGVVFDPNKM